MPAVDMLKKRKIAIISAVVWPISTKFEKMTHAVRPSCSFWSLKICYFKHWRWRRPPSWKSKHRHISTWRWRSLALSTIPILTFWNNENRRWRHLEKSPYISICLTDLHETLYIDAVWSSWPFWSLKFRKFKNPRRRRPPFWKIGIWPYSRNCLTEHYETWYGDAYCHPDRGDRHNFEIL